jgi:hypothetical protein
MDVQCRLQSTKGGEAKGTEKKEIAEPFPKNHHELQLANTHPVCMYMYMQDEMMQRR